MEFYIPLPTHLRDNCLMNISLSRPIRVMRIIARMNVGGPAVQVSGLMRGLNPNDFDHRLYTGFCATYEADYLETAAKDVSAIRIKGLGRHINVIRDISAFVSLVQEIHNFKPDIIHTHTAKAGFLGRLASILAFQRSIRVHTFHGHLLHGYFGPLKTRLVIVAERVLATFTHQLLAVGEKVRQDLLNAGVGNIKKFDLMPPGVEINELPDKEKSLLALSLSNDRLQCALIGRVTEIKRPDRFLDVVREVKRRSINLDFFIAGDGERLESCRERILNEKLPIKLLGWQNDIEQVLSAADIVILTSDNEGTPISLIQAGMARLPVVTTNVGSVSEIVLNGVTGIITGLSVQEMADALEILVSDNSLRQTLGLAGREFTLKNYGVHRLVHDHEELYRKLTANRAKI